MASYKYRPYLFNFHISSLRNYIILGLKFSPYLGNSLSLLSFAKWIEYLSIGGIKAGDFSWMLVLGNLVEYL
jgi:hypothetical protein